MAGDFDTLIDMGFPENKVYCSIIIWLILQQFIHSKKALADTGNSGLQPAMDWLIAHADDSDDVEESQTATKEDNSKEGEDEGNHYDQ